MKDVRPHFAEIKAQEKLVIEGIDSCTSDGFYAAGQAFGKIDKILFAYWEPLLMGETEDSNEEDVFPSCVNTHACKEGYWCNMFHNFTCEEAEDDNDADVFPSCVNTHACKEGYWCNMYHNFTCEATDEVKAAFALY